MNEASICGCGPLKSFCLSLLLSSSLLLTTTSNAAKPDPRPDGDSVDLGGGFVEHMGFVSASEAGVDFTDGKLRHLGISIGQLGGVNPETGEVITNEWNLLSLVAWELDITGSAFFNTNIFIDGDTVIGGIMYGNGAGISNLPAASIQGSLATRPEIQALDTKAEEIRGVVVEHAADIAELELKATEQQQASADTNNPHQVTAEQLEALPCSGGGMYGPIDMRGMAQVINLPEPVNDQDAVSKCYLERRLNYIEPQGDIGMGTYTNHP